MNKRGLDYIKSILNEREYQAVTTLIKEVNCKDVSGDNVNSYITDIRKTLNTISYRKDMLTHALNVLEKYVECGERGDLEFEECIKGSQLLDA